MADLDQLRDGLHISISQIGSYIRCGRAYELKYVLGVQPAFRPTPLVFGSAFHHSAARFFLAVKEEGSPPPLRLLTEAFRDAWERELEADVPLQADDDEPTDTGVFVDKGTEMLTVFYDHAAKLLDGVKISGVEQPFAVSLTNLETGEAQEEQLVGAFDLVTTTNGRCMITELKTSARRFGPDEVRWGVQPTGYVYAGRMMGLQSPTARYVVVTKARSPVVQVLDLQRDADDELEFLRLASAVLRGIDAGVFPPVRSWACKGCPYAHACRPPRPKAAAAG